MPLRCITANGQELRAYAIPEAEWRDLKRDHRTRGLRLPCCEAVAIPKTSHRGTQFFQHKARGPCTTAPETADHIECKAIIARSAEEAGWQAETEMRGEAPDGRSWVADVLCSKPGRPWRIAFEVQLTQESEDILRERQARYSASGVRCAWLLKNPPPWFWQRPDPDIPAFTLSLTDGAGGWQPSVRNTYRARKNGTAGHGPVVVTQSPPLADFVRLALSGGLKWRTMEGEAIPVTFTVGEMACAECEGPVYVASQVVLLFEHVWPGAGCRYQNARGTVFHHSELREALRKVRRKYHGLTLFNREQTRAGEVISKVSAKCPRCGALTSANQPDLKERLGRWVFGELLPGTIEPKFLPRPHWFFDLGDGHSGEGHADPGGDGDQVCGR